MSRNLHGNKNITGYNNSTEKQELGNRSLLNAIPDMMFIFSKDGTILHYHADEESLLYTSPEQFLNRNVDDVLPEEVAVLTHRIINKVLTTGLNEEYTYTLTIQGEKYIFDSRMVPLDKNRTLAIVRDVTGRVKAQKKLNEKNCELIKTRQKLENSNKQLIDLNHILEEQKNELIEAKEKAEESDKLKSAFLANMSHEIRTPMNGIMGFAKLLESNNLTEERQKEYLQIILQSGKRMLNIINDLIDISRIESGHTEIYSTKTSINCILRDQYEFFRREAETKNLQFNLHLAEPNKDINIFTDSVKFTQILNNLIKNAIKFTEHGKIDFGYRMKKNWLVFFVEDTGVGIDPHMQDKIFERFRQVHNSNARPYEGAGLGLAITKAFVEMLGGTIHVKSERGKGSTFSFSIPVKVTARDKEIGERLV
ncbi:MAG: PAS domain-containing sensor histidine kinase [Bacteroidales bacterium]